VLGQLLDVEPSTLEFDRTCPWCGAKHGKPRIIWPESSLDFSISVSADRALLGVSTNTRVGVDLEFQFPQFDVSALARRWLTGPELGAISALPAKDRQAWFLRTWTRKEAILKALGTGLSKDPRYLTVGEADGNPMRAKWLHGDAEAPVFVQDVEFTDYGAAVAALALEGIHPGQPTITKLP
jgi:4'-phosphopantetheinyl transferase